jgi:DNA-directed RNA polymerase specialized sigma24 family protein
MISHREVIMSRIRRMLRRAVAARDVTDTGDISSAMLSRIDSLAVDGRLRAATDAAVWTLVLMTCKHLVLEKARVADRLRRLAAAYGDHLLLIAAEVDDSASDDDASGRILGLLRSLGTDADRELLILKLNDVPDRSIGESLGIGEDAVRQRWSRLTRPTFR